MRGTKLQSLLFLPAILVLAGCSGALAYGDNFEAAAEIQWERKPVHSVGASSDEEAANGRDSGPHNKVEGGFQIGDAFIPDEVAGLPIVDVLSSEDTPCISGAVVTVRGIPGDDMPVRLLLQDLFAGRGGAIVTNITDRISNEDVYAANERRIEQESEQGCTTRRFGGPGR